MKSRNTTFFEYMFSFKKSQKIYSFKRMNEASLNSHPQIENYEVEPIMSNRVKNNKNV